jgi:cell division protein FtsW
MFKFNKIILILVILLSFLGLVIFFSASYYYSLKNFNNPYFYFFHFFSKITLLGFLFFLAGNFLSQRLRKFKKILFLVFILIYFSMFLAFLPQFKISSTSAARWVNLGFTSFQPSEIIKPFALLFLIFLILKFKKLPLFQRITIFIVFLLFILGPIYFQPAFSNGLIILMSLGSAFLASLNSKREVFISFILFFLIALLFAFVSIFWEYRVERITSFLTKGKLYEERYFHLEIAQLGISEGGLFGKGLGRSETKIIGIPQLLTDSIFVVYAAELGFIGSVILIFLFFLLILMIIYKGIKSNDEINKLFSFGTATWIFSQTFLHLASNVGLIVPTGVILPFFSYGASGQLAIYFSLGIISRDE